MSLYVSTLHFVLNLFYAYFVYFFLSTSICLLYSSNHLYLAIKWVIVLFKPNKQQTTTL